MGWEEAVPGGRTVDTANVPARTQATQLPSLCTLQTPSASPSLADDSPVVTLWGAAVHGRSHFEAMTTLSPQPTALADYRTALNSLAMVD